MAVASGVTPKCCGSDMQKLKANTSEGSQEKHIPEVEVVDEHTIKVRVGSMPHPMMEDHYIRFVCLETSKGGIIRYLEPGCEPEVTFCFMGKPKAVYAYCNIHGLWKKNIV